MASLENQLFDVKEVISRAKTKKAQLEGARSQLKKQMDTEFGCKTEKAADKAIAGFQTKADDLKNKIESRVAKLQKKYGLEI